MNEPIDQLTVNKTLFCAQCGNETHDDHSELWESAWDNSGELSRVCYDCVPPDDE